MPKNFNNRLIILPVAILLCLALLSCSSADSPKEKAEKFWLQGDTKKQLVELDRHLVQHPDDISVLCNRASALAELKNYKDAIATYSKVISLQPNLSQVWYQRANVYFKIGKYQECLDDCKHSLSLESNDSETHELSSRANQKLKHNAAAIEDLSKAINWKISPVKELMQRAKLYRITGQYQLAVNDCTRVRQLDWGADEAFIERARVYELQGKKDLANTDIDELNYYRANTVRFSVGEPIRAIADLKTGKYISISQPSTEKTEPKPAPQPPKELGVSEIVPNGKTQVEYYHLARHFRMLPKQALECITRVEKMNPANPVAIKTSLLRDTMLPKQMPSDDAIALNFRAFNEISNPDQCRQDILKCINRFPEFEYGYITLGALEKDCGNGAAAVKNFRHALAINPHNTEALSRLGDILRWHDLPEAKRIFKQAVLYDPDDTMSWSFLESYKFDD